EVSRRLGTAHGRIGEEVNKGNARRHLVQHRLHLTRIGAVQPEIREQHNHVYSLPPRSAHRNFTTVVADLAYGVRPRRLEQGSSGYIARSVTASERDHGSCAARPRQSSRRDTCERYEPLHHPAPKHEVSPRRSYPTTAR